MSQEVFYDRWGDPLRVGKAERRALELMAQGPLTPSNRPPLRVLDSLVSKGLLRARPMTDFKRPPHGIGLNLYLSPTAERFMSLVA